MSDVWQTDYETWLKEGGTLPPPFSPNMPTPRTPKLQSVPGFAWISRMDAKLQNWLFSPKASDPGFAYLDVRGKWWSIKWNTSSFTWNAFPLGDTARDYNAEFNTTAFEPKRMFAAASDSEGIVSAINARVEALRPSGSSGSSGSLLWLLVAAAIIFDGGKKR